MRVFSSLIFTFFFSVITHAAPTLTVTCILSKVVDHRANDESIFKEIGRDTQVVDANSNVIILRGGDEKIATFIVTLLYKDRTTITDSGETVDVKTADMYINDYICNRRSTNSLVGVDPTNHAFRIVSTMSSAEDGDGHLSLVCSNSVSSN